MERHGIATDLAVSGAQALEMIASTAYRVVFMDFHMPEMDGAETAWQMRRRLGDACPPIVVVTADVFLEDKVGRGSAFDDQLLKPISDSGLERVLKRWLWSARQGRSDDGHGPEPGSGVDRRPPRQAEEGGSRIPDDLRAELGEEVGRLHRSIDEAVARKDQEAAADLAHQLQGLAGVYGLGSLGADAARVAEIVRSGRDEAELPTLLARMRESLGALRAEPDVRAGRGGSSS
jgi:CheY-like chemotaxis protein